MAVNLWVMCTLFAAGGDGGSGNPVGQVVPINWARLALDPPRGEDMRACPRMLLNSVRYNLGWVATEYEKGEANGDYVIADMEEHGIRMPSSAAYGVATALKTGIYDEKVVGVARRDALARVIKLVKAVTIKHKVNGHREGWGDSWQSAAWAALVGTAGWLMWEDLDAETRRLVARAVEFEADRFVRPDYRVPYWNGKGGDTKAEENAWNAMVLQLAVAMMPKHPQVPQWKRIGSELMVSAFAMKADAESNTTLLDGRQVREWLGGYNMRDDGAVVNHGLIHCDYMTTVTLNLKSFIIQSLAGQSVPETADFNAAKVYRCLVHQEWPSPPYQPPGGTMYSPGKAEVYYPNGTDWSRFRFPIFYLTDVYAHLLGWDQGWQHRAADWMRVRAERILAMQARHPDGRTWAKGEFETYRGCEQMACWLFADAFLVQWLQQNLAIGKRGNWNQP